MKKSSVSPNIGTLLNGVLTPKLLNSPFAFWFLINLDFLLTHIAHFDIIALPLLLLETFGFMFSTLQTIWFHFIHIILKGIQTFLNVAIKIV